MEYLTDNRMSRKNLRACSVGFQAYIDLKDTMDMQKSVREKNWPFFVADVVQPVIYVKRHLLKATVIGDYL